MTRNGITNHMVVKKNYVIFDAIQEVIESGKVGVIVREMIPAMVGGVAFLSNPLNARKDEMLIEMVNGKQSRLMEGVRQAENLVIKKAKFYFHLDIMRK